METGTEKGEVGASVEGSGGRGEKHRSVSQECANIWDSLLVGRCRLDSAPTTSVTDVTAD